ncbi:MAG TPA: VOC family protein [Terriglobales bacterium]|jgi:PhnB protein|nr:VOC family protein [Terriglobales bacterium]
MPATKVRYVPVGYHTATPYLIIGTGKAADALQWYKDVFAAVEQMRFPAPDGRIGHAETQIGDSHIMLADEYPEMGYRGPESLGGSPSLVLIYVEDVDSVFKKALAHGAKVMQGLKDQFYGDRNGTITDPFGHNWTIATHIEDVTPEEMRRRMSAGQK